MNVGGHSRGARIKGESRTPNVVNFYDNSSIARNGALTQRAYYTDANHAEKIGDFYFPRSEASFRTWISSPV